MYLTLANTYLQARHNGQSYVFALLTGYRDPPAGVSVAFFAINIWAFFVLMDFGGSRICALQLLTFLDV